MMKIQESLKKMSSSLQSNQALYASALVGRTVLVASNQLNLDVEGDANKAIVDLPARMSYLSASIYTKTDELVQTIALGQPGPGYFQFVWDGIGKDNQRAIAGNYTVKIKGVYDGKEIALKTLTSANIDSVSLSKHGEGLKLNVSGVGMVPYDQVQLK